MYSSIGLPVRLKSRVRPAGCRLKGAAGFTLLEILMAFLIMSLSFTVLFQVFSGGLLGLTRAEQRIESLQHAESLLARVGADISLEVGRQSGSFETGPEWEVAIDLYQEEGASISDALRGRLYEVEVTVRGMGPPISLQSLRLGEAR